MHIKIITMINSLVKIIPLTCFLMAPAFATVYYTSPTTGINDPTRGTASKPWLTLQYGALQLHAGDTLIVGKGTYMPTGKIDISLVGTSDKWISIIGEASQRPVFNFTNWNSAPHSLSGGALNFANCKYVRLQHVTVINTPCEAIQCNNSDNIAFVACSTFNTISSGISSLASTNILIADNIVKGACVGNEGYQESITIGNTQYFEVRNNEVSFSDVMPSNLQSMEGIDCKAGAAFGKVWRNNVHHLHRVGLYVDAWTSNANNIELCENTVYDCAVGVNIGSERNGNTQNITIHHNILYNNAAAGVIVDNYMDPAQKDITISNNTICHNGYNNPWPGESGIGYGIGIETNRGQNIRVFNNLLYDNFSDQIRIVNPGAMMSQTTIDYNFLKGDQTHTEGIGSHAIMNLDPGFVNAATHDYHVRAGSKVIDAGAPTTQLDPDGTRADIGALFYNQALVGVRSAVLDKQINKQQVPHKQLTIRSRYLRTSKNPGFSISGKAIESENVYHGSGWIFEQH